MTRGREQEQDLSELPQLLEDEAEGPSKDGDYYWEPELEPKHKIFLSHSGDQKNFTEQLCLDLEKWEYSPFFDKWPDSLPKGQKFPELIFQAAQQCRVAILVLSEGFFTRTKWPMLELEAFVQSQKDNPGKLAILPVYLGLSRNECTKNKVRHRHWLSVWRDWAQNEDRIDVGKWEDALKVLGSSNGIEYIEPLGEVALREQILSSIQRLIPPELSRRAAHVKGRTRRTVILEEFPGLTSYASITNESDEGEGEIEAESIFLSDKSKSKMQLQLELEEIWNGKPTSIPTSIEWETNLPIDLTRDLLGASSRGYVIRTTCPDGHGGRYPCALKRIDTTDESEPDLARLCHPHVVNLLHHWKKKIDYGEVREWMPKPAFMTFLIMELMDGDLRSLMTSIKTTGLTPFSILVAVHMMLQIAKGMLYLHEMGVSHPHLKCNNVLCRVKSTAQIPFRVGDVLVKLGGFGCSRAANDDTKNRDVFCFGLTCAEILTGDECFEDICGPDKVSRPSIPETTPRILKDCIASCLDTKITFSEAITLLLLAQSQIIQTCEDKMILCSVNLDINSTLSNNQDIASSSTSKSDRQEMFHVHQLHPQLGEVATSVQMTLIFFHGFPKVSEEWRMTWLTRDNKLVWPQMWLPEDLGADIRVLSVSFDDNPNVSSTQSIMDLLKILVMSATCKLGESDQAIVLVGHSFGGVIIKSLVAAAQGLAGNSVDNNVEFQEVLKCKKFLKRLASIVFYSVPHAFANMEFENYISGCSNTRVLQRSSLLKALRRDSVFISDMIQLSRDFEIAVPRKTKLLAFLEGKPMSKKSLLVKENSWEGLLLSWEWHKIDRDNHFEVCRPVSKSHIGYKVLLNHLQQHMCSPSAVNVRRVWKVIGTVLICICKFKEVLSRYRMVSRTIEDMTPNELLLTCATAIELKDVSTIKQTVSALRNISSVNGEPSERVTAYFLQALQRRCVSMLGPKFLSGADLPSSREEQEATSRWMLDVLTNFVDLSPYVRFGYVAANGAMLKAFEGMGRIHIVDFSTTHGMQWRFFIDALADRVGGPPNFRLTLSGPSLPIVPHPTYEEIGHRLTKYAHLRNVPLEFNVLAPPLERLSSSDFDMRDGEALGVNFSLGLHYLADESAGLPEYPPPLETQLQPRCPRDNLLHLIRSLNPTIVTLYEEDCDATSTDVVERVHQSYEHEWISFDIMATLLPSENKERQQYEKIVGMKIENIVACEGERRIVRLESRRQWMQRMRRLGFLSLPVGYDVVSALRDILDHGSEMRNEVNDCTQSLLWKGRRLAFASAWAPHFSNPAACLLDSGEHRRQQQECQKTFSEAFGSLPFDFTSTLNGCKQCGTLTESGGEDKLAVHTGKKKVEENSKIQTIELDMDLCCDSCVRKVRRGLEFVQGVEKVVCDQVNNKVFVKGSVKPEVVLKKARRVKKFAKLVEKKSILDENNVFLTTADSTIQEAEGVEKTVTWGGKDPYYPDVEKTVTWGGKDPHYPDPAKTFTWGGKDPYYPDDKLVGANFYPIDMDEMVDGLGRFPGIPNLEGRSY